MASSLFDLDFDLSNRMENAIHEARIEMYRELHRPQMAEIVGHIARWRRDCLYSFEMCADECGIDIMDNPFDMEHQLTISPQSRHYEIRMFYEENPIESILYLWEPLTRPTAWRVSHIIYDPY